jgi:hypothetical protein
MAPNKGGIGWAEIIGPGSSAMSSVLLLIKERTCQTIAWVGVDIDTANNVGAVTN